MPKKIKPERSPEKYFPKSSNEWSRSNVTKRTARTNGTWRTEYRTPLVSTSRFGGRNTPKNVFRLSRHRQSDRHGLCPFTAKNRPVENKNRKLGRVPSDTRRLTKKRRSSSIFYKKKKLTDRKTRIYIWKRRITRTIRARARHRAILQFGAFQA